MSSSHDHKPAQEEPKTPAWLTALGISLLVLAGLGWLFTRPAAPTVEQMRSSEAPTAQSAPAPAASAPAAPAGSALDPRLIRRQPRPAPHEP